MQAADSRFWAAGREAWRRPTCTSNGTTRSENRLQGTLSGLPQDMFPEWADVGPSSGVLKPKVERQPSPVRRFALRIPYSQISMSLHFRDQPQGRPENIVALSQIVCGRSVIAPVCLRPQRPWHAFRPCGKWAGTSGGDLSRTADLRRFWWHRRRPAVRQTPQSCVARRTETRIFCFSRQDRMPPIRADDLVPRRLARAQRDRAGLSAISLPLACGTNLRPCIRRRRFPGDMRTSIGGETENSPSRGPWGIGIYRPGRDKLVQTDLDRGRRPPQKLISLCLFTRQRHFRRGWNAVARLGRHVAASGSTVWSPFRSGISDPRPEKKPRVPHSPCLNPRSGCSLYTSGHRDVPLAFAPHVLQTVE